MSTREVLDEIIKEARKTLEKAKGAIASGDEGKAAKQLQNAEQEIGWAEKEFRSERMTDQAIIDEADASQLDSSQDRDQIAMLSVLQHR